MANYDTNQTDADLSQPEALPGAGTDEFGFELEKQPANRAGIILVFLLLLGGGGLYFLYTQSSFAKGGEPIAVASADNAGAAVQISAIRQGLSETRRIVSIFEQMNARPYVPVADLKSNPFSTVRQAPVATPQQGTSADADPMVAKIAQAGLDLGLLKLSSIMDADQNSTCNINGRILRIGQKIKPQGGLTEFTFLRVETETTEGRAQTRAILGAYDQEFVLVRK